MPFEYCFDLDLTLCFTEGTDYENAVPIVNRIEKVNRLYEAGHIIKIYTARGSKSGLDFYELTKKQLSNWGVCFHELHLGKPAADFYIDDKAVAADAFPWDSN